MNSQEGERLPQPYSAALPITNVVLRTLLVLNWLMGVFAKGTGVRDDLEGTM
jgi:hypothetical protein